MRLIALSNVNIDTEGFATVFALALAQGRKGRIQRKGFATLRGRVITGLRVDLVLVQPFLLL